jgi:hypothetical protein
MLRGMEVTWRDSTAGAALMPETARRREAMMALVYILKVLVGSWRLVWVKWKSWLMELIELVCWLRDK